MHKDRNCYVKSTQNRLLLSQLIINHHIIKSTYRKRELMIMLIVQRNQHLACKIMSIFILGMEPVLSVHPGAGPWGRGRGPWGNFITTTIAPVSTE